jgi:DNA-binding NarL/FixJ family response regulator
VPIRLILADDHPLILDGIEQLVRLAGDLEVLERCVNGGEALKAIEKHRPDVAVLDIRMPGMDGLSVLAEIHRRRLPTRVVLLTAELSERELLGAIRQGVGGVVLKEMAPRLLVQCLRKVHAGERWIEHRSMLGALDTMLRRETGAQEAASELTPREIQLIRMVAQGLRNREIAGQLSIAESTVKVHLHNIYRKIQVENRVAVRRYAEEKGLI